MIDEKKLLADLNNFLFRTEMNSVAYKTIEQCIECVDEQPQAVCSRREWYQLGYQDGLNANKWIPCEERLPKLGDFVLASIKEHLADKHRIVIVQYLGQTYWEVGIIEAWQPLPAPYKKEGAENEV